MILVDHPGEADYAGVIRGASALLCHASFAFADPHLTPTRLTIQRILQILLNSPASSVVIRGLRRSALLLTTATAVVTAAVVAVVAAASPQNDQKNDDTAAAVAAE